MPLSVPLGGDLAWPLPIPILGQILAFWLYLLKSHVLREKSHAKILEFILLSARLLLMELSVSLKLVVVKLIEIALVTRITLIAVLLVYVNNVLPWLLAVLVWLTIFSVVHVTLAMLHTQHSELTLPVNVLLL
jgi:hypothetical protein